jgi:hypothetical protein
LYNQGEAMSIIKALTTVAGTAIVSATIGTAVGYCLGAYVPGAYRSMFPHGVDPRFNPVEVGIGLGCAQGLIAGVVIGLVVVCAVTWHEIRTAEIQSRSAARQDTPP